MENKEEERSSASSHAATTAEAAPFKSKKTSEAEPFPSLDDVDLLSGDFTELQISQFLLVEEQLKLLGAGQSKEMAKSSATTLVDQIKGVDFKDGSTLPETLFGRKLIKVLKGFFRAGLGVTLFAIVQNNYPTERYIQKRSEYVAKLEKLSVQTDEETVTPQKPQEYQVHELRRNIAWNVHLKTLQAQGVGKMSLRSGSKVSASEAEDDTESMTQDQFCADLDRKYLESIEAYESALLKQSVKEALQRKCKAEMARTVIQATILEGIWAAQQALISKIRGAITNSVQIRQKLSRMVQLEATQEVITNPYENGNLAGMYQILEREYHKPNLVRFNTDLQRTMRTTVTQEAMAISLMRAVDATEELVDVWDTMDYWKYMTPDMFWTNILLNAMPSSEFKTQCVEKVHLYMTRKEDGGLRDDASDHSSMGSNSKHVFDYLRAYIKMCDDSAKLTPLPGAAAAPKKLTPTPPHSQPYGRGRGGNVEFAAAGASQYTGMVTREQNVACKDTDTGMEFPYTATKEVCALCWGKSVGGFNPDSHRPRCYKGPCRTCGLYGHKFSGCLQHTSTYARKPSQQGAPPSTL